MAKAKTSKDASKSSKAPARDESAIAIEAPAVSSEALLHELGKAERAFLQRVSRFLLGIASKSIYRRAAAHGYTESEHKLGWSLYRTAMGETRPLDTLVGAQPVPVLPRELLQQLDGFENLWMPRVRSVIRRFAPKASREALEAAVFEGLEQQPLGPGVVGSVSLLLRRVDELKSSKIEGAAKVRAVLAERGLTEARIGEIRALLARGEAPESAASADKSDVSAEQREQEQLAAQHEALADLRLWREDWRATLTPVFEHHVLVQLGLLAQTGGRKRADDGDDGEDGEDTDQGFDEKGRDPRAK